MFSFLYYCSLLNPHQFLVPMTPLKLLLSNSPVMSPLLNSSVNSGLGSVWFTVLHTGSSLGSWDTALSSFAGFSHSPLLVPSHLTTSVWSSPGSWSSFLLYLRSPSCGFHTVSILWQLPSVYLQPRTSALKPTVVYWTANWALQNCTPDLSPQMSVSLYLMQLYPSSCTSQ